MLMGSFLLGYILHGKCKRLLDRSHAMVREVVLGRVERGQYSYLGTIMHSNEHKVTNLVRDIGLHISVCSLGCLLLLGLGWVDLAESEVSSEHFLLVRTELKDK